jgi:hypothetical protein
VAGDGLRVAIRLVPRAKTDRLVAIDPQQLIEKIMPELGPLPGR